LLPVPHFHGAGNEPAGRPHAAQPVAPGRRGARMIAVEFTLATHVLDALADAVGGEYVSTNLSDRLANSRGVWPVELKAMRRALIRSESDGLPLPGCVVWPSSTEEV